VPRRVRLPGADELFRSTGEPDAEPARASEGGGVARLPLPERRDAVAEGVDAASSAPQDGGEQPDLAAGDQVHDLPVRRRAGLRPSGRERHQEKITVYCSAEELLQLESARLTLRGHHGLAVDRGRIVREALAVLLADLDAKGDSSILVRRLRSR
jgi:hypothetical protein